MYFVYIYNSHCIIYYTIAGLKSKKSQLEQNQRILQEKIGRTVTGTTHRCEQLILFILSIDSLDEVQHKFRDHKSQLENEKRDLQEVGLHLQAPK